MTGRQSRTTSTLPALVRMALRLILPAEDKEFFLGDLQESGYRSWHRELWGAAS